MTKFLQDLLFKGALTVDGVVTLTNNVQIGNSRLDVHNIYGATTFGNGSTGTDITALTVKAMGTGASKNFRVLNTNGDGEIFATQENAFVLIGGNVIPTNNRTGFTFDAFGVSPVAFNIVTRSNNTGGVFRGLHVTEGNLNGLSGGNFDSRYVEVAPLFNATGGSEYTVRGFYYNPTITNLTGSIVTHYAFESTAGQIKISDLSGTGARMVVANAAGVLSTQAIPTVSLTDTLDSVTTRGNSTTNSITVGNVTATSYSIANTFWAGLGYKNNNNGNMGMLFSGQDVILYTGQSSTIDTLHLFGTTQNVGIGATTDAGYRLDINGTLRVQGNVTLSSASNLVTLNQFYGQATGYANSIFVGWDASAVYLGYSMGSLDIHLGSNGSGQIRFRNTGGFRVESFSGTGSRMVVADSTGILTTQAIPTGSLQGALDADKSTSGSLSIGTTIVKAVSATTYSGVFFDYVVKNGTNVRVGSVVAISNGTNVEFYETLSNDIGTTTDVTFTVTLGSGNINLNAVAAATGWTVIVSTRAI
jgi:hypothetical protein